MGWRGSYLQRGTVLGFLALVAWWPLAAGVAPITIVTQPQDQAVKPGQTATFTVVATSRAPRLHYQWYRLARPTHPWFSQPIHGATAPSYTTPPESLRQDGSQFFVQVSHGWSVVLSRRARLTVRSVTPPAQPGVSLAPFVTGGKTGLVASTADQGPGMTYTWIVTGGVLTAGQGTPSITFTAGAAGTTLKASVRVVNAEGRASGSASARIVAAPNAELALPISVHPGDGWMQASVPAQTDMTYLWTVVPGSATAILTAGQGSGVVAFTAGNSEGTFQLQVNVQNRAGDDATCIRTVTVRRGAWLVENGGPTLPRTGATATLLPSGRVLVVGGYDYNGGYQIVANAEIYDPVTGHWNRTGDLGTPRLEHTATLLSDGRVLVAGGAGDAGGIGGSRSLASAELYDPLTGVWTPAAAMNTWHSMHTATLLRNGRVLVTAGYGKLDRTDIAELYDPGTDTWTLTGILSVPRAMHTATLLPGGQVLVTGGGELGAAATAERYDPVSGTWSRAGAMQVNRYHYTATLLTDGRVLVTGGDLSVFSVSSEIYDPSTNTWSATGQPATARQAHTAVLLSDGRVLVTGGDVPSPPYSSLSSSEIYDPGTGLWSPTGDLAVARQDHTATMLSSGSVLVAGGWDRYSGSEATPEFFDPVAGTWSTQEGLGSARDGHTATPLPDGRVLVVGGTSGTQALLYDPKTRAWAPAPGMKTSRVNHTATLLKDGRVLVVGGKGALGSAELYDPGSGTWAPTGSLGKARYSHTASLLPCGLVLITGGLSDGTSELLADSEIYDPAKGTWRPSGSLAVARYGQTATTLPDGGILVVGGYGGPLNRPLASAERCDPGSGTWHAAGTPALQRSNHTATLLPDGRVLVVGGFEPDSPTTGAEFYDPATNSWTPTGSLGTARMDHAAVLLPGGHVLVMGGNTLLTNLASAEEYDPSMGTWTPAGALETARSRHSATLLQNGTVLVAFGVNGDVVTEIYKP